MEENSFPRLSKTNPYYLTLLENYFVIPDIHPIPLDPQCKEVIYNIFSLTQQGQYAQALQLCDNLLNSPHRHEVLFIIKAKCLICNEYYEPALQLLHELKDAPHTTYLAEIFHNLALLMIRQKNFAKAVTFYKKAVSLKEDLGASWAALAFIYGIERKWKITYDYAKKALSYGANIDVGLIDICLSGATYNLSMPMEGYFDFRSIYLKEKETYHALEQTMTFLPKIDPQSLKLPKTQKKLAVFISCDRNYFVEHAMPCILSLARAQANVIVHIHCFNPPSDFARSIDKLKKKVAPLEISFSTEIADMPRYAPENVFYSSMRFCRFRQFILENEIPALMVDADVLFRKCPTKISSIKPDTDFALLDGRDTVFWETILGGVIYCKNTPATQYFLAHVCLFILDNFKNDRRKWFLDQMALIFTYIVLFSKHKGCHFLKIKECCNIECEEEAAIWVITNNKNHLGPYNDYKKQIIENPYYSTGSLFNDITRSKYGFMIVNKNDMYISHSIIHHGSWSEDELNIANFFIQKGNTVLDIGANIGSHTLAFARMVGNHGKVLSFEPQRMIYYNLAGSVALNSLTNVICYNKALGKECGQITIPILDYERLHNFGSCSLDNGWNGNTELKPLSTKGEKVDLITLDSLDLDECHFIKMDTEGMEAPIIAGAKNTIERFRPIIFSEALNTQAGKDLIDAMKASNYRVYLHEVGGDRNVLCLPQENKTQINGLQEI